MTFSAGSKYSEGAVVVVTDDTTVTAADSGNIYIVNAADKTITLPATEKGLFYHITADATAVASGSVGTSVSPVAADGINGGVVNKDLINTAATDVIGDCVTVVGSGTAGVTAWAVISKGGIWAAEA